MLYVKRWENAKKSCSYSKDWVYVLSMGQREPVNREVQAGFIHYIYTALNV